ncbi:MAG: vanadium-dependent haloperoxidase, partial [Draconibacterium sp.]|nr:vanadium-dependent haloperoxidase [Draconibacterium sp.]
HWVGIAAQAARNMNKSYEETVYGLTKVKIAVADAFISCWDEKYRSNLVRPETLINKYWDENWLPILQTPPFPEYTSGHSVVSGAAAVACTNVFGENYAFADSVEVEYGLPVREFESFNQASEEAAMSRLYGGIHYNAANKNGISQGRNLGHFIMDKLVMKND